ncbi:cytochrome P450 [Dactylosporangium sp. NPDC000555]|uniref:cytochrome P450 n=1 Tax=Dactylosporangium sp. NPDC000555 TaxID=3154260 RepID=UPI00331652EB
MWADYESLRALGAVTHSSHYDGFWLITSHDAAKQVLRNHDAFSSTPSHRLPQGNAPSVIPIDFDQPEHTAYRDAVVEAVRPHRLRAAGPFIVETVSAAVDAFYRRGGGEVRRGLSIQIPFRVLTGVLGISQETVEALLAQSDPPAGSQTDGQHHSTDQRIRALLVAEIAAHRSRPAPAGDYVDWLLTERVDAGLLTEAEAVDILLTLAVAGFRTTMNSISTLVYLLASDQRLQERLRADPSQSAYFVEEMLRLRSPAQNIARRTRCPVHIGDVEIPANERVVVSVAAANRDPAEYAAGAEFDPSRPARGHLAFGWGIHQCAGAPLARAELKALLESLCSYPPFRLDGDVEFGHIKEGIHFGPSSMHVRFAAERVDRP